MSRARVARRIAAAAAYGGGGIGLIGVGLVGLLLAEAKIAEHQLDTLKGEPPRADGRYGTAFAAADARPLRFAVLGDSTAAGFGVDRGRETPGALLAGGIASVTERPVDLYVVAANGATSEDLVRQTEVLLQQTGPEGPELALIMIGANDVTQMTKRATAVRLLGDTLKQLRTVGAEVVVATCPDLGTIEPVRPPLRWLARRASRQLAAAQAITVVEAGGRTVSLGDLLGREFRGRHEMFASDRYHPSAQGYATAAMAMLPTLCAAIGVWPEIPHEQRAEGLHSLAKAAAVAAAHGGTEVAPAGHWAQLLRRARRPLSAVGNGGGTDADRRPTAPAAGAESAVDAALSTSDSSQ
ncbi:SGNH/GDSL hydrolase family protein [Streptacidiphilus jiangxiensis]|uniref:Lysophospholipase L1 n=1 Tax=Streptacidiphilus jiangxiensis TaxID=235985 RepID=A0A1H7FJV4_STRJI|nr:SGNH/GDSL hydrolase family protein [Streptacidiphilus jiangxiensis]SEK25527.1 Lysophospholipase L1 [Streptacidiphilus jiangxiensis]